MCTKSLSPLYVSFASLMVVVFLLSGCSTNAVNTTTPIPMVSTQVSITEPEQSESTEYGLTQFGLLTVLPESGGTTFSTRIIDAIKTTGVRYMRISLDWAVSEPQQGQLSFNTKNDQMIQEIEAAGLHVFPTIYVGSGWMNGSPAGRQAGGSRSYPPGDLSKQWNDQYGYSPGYYNFVFKFFSHYQGHFEYVAIENEANSSIFWGGTADDYVRLLKTAYKAIKAVDPKVIVVDSGFVSNAIGLCIAADYLKSGSKTMDEVLQFVKSYYIYDATKPKVNTNEQLQQTLNQSKVQEQCQRINYMLDNMGGSVDAVNFHFYEDYRVLPAVVAWLRQRTAAAGYSPSIVSNEMGIRIQGADFATSSAHAKELVKDMVTSMSLGLRAVIWFSADTTQIGKDKVGIFDSNGQLRPAGNSMKLVINTMSTVSSFHQASSTGPNLYHYIFENPNDVPSLDILWVEGNLESIQLQLPAGTTQELIIDYSGKSYTLPIQEGSIKLSAGDSPLFVSWK